MVRKKNTRFIDREKLSNSSNDDLLRVLEKTSSKLYQTELLLEATLSKSAIALPLPLAGGGEGSGPPKGSL